MSSKKNKDAIRKDFICEITNLQEVYKEDKKIFDKYKFLLDTYMTKGAWPFNIENFLNEAENILNHDYIKAISFYKKFIKDEKVNKDLNLEKEFEQDLKFYSAIIGDTVLNAMNCKNDPFGFDSIHATDIVDGKATLKIARSDNESFKFDVDMETVEGLSQFFKDLLEDFEENLGE